LVKRISVISQVDQSDSGVFRELKEISTNNQIVQLNTHHPKVRLNCNHTKENNNRLRFTSNGQNKKRNSTASIWISG
jgi:hypothetical protein